MSAVGDADPDDVAALIEAEALRLLAPPTRSVAAENASRATRPLELLIEAATATAAPLDELQSQSRPLNALRFLAEWQPPRPTKLDAAYRRCLADRARAKAIDDERKRLEREAEERECTFHPVISDASSKMARSAGGDTNFFDAGQEWLKRRKKKLDAKRAKLAEERSEAEKEEFEKNRVTISKRSIELAAHVDKAPLSPPPNDPSQRMRRGRPAASDRDLQRKPSFSPVVGERSRQLAHAVQAGVPFVDRMVEDAKDREDRAKRWVSPAKTVKLDAWEMQDAIERLYSPPERVYEYRQSVPLPPEATPTFTPRTTPYTPRGSNGGSDRVGNGSERRERRRDFSLRRQLFDPVESFVAKSVVLPPEAIDSFVERTHEWHQQAMERRDEKRARNEEDKLRECTFRPKISAYDLSMHHWESSMSLSQVKRSTETMQSVQRAKAEMTQSSSKSKVAPFSPDGWQKLRRAPSGSTSSRMRSEGAANAAAAAAPQMHSQHNNASSLSTSASVASSGGGGGGGGGPAARGSTPSFAGVDDSRESVQELRAWFGELERASKSHGCLPRATALGALRTFAHEVGVHLRASAIGELEAELSARIAFADFVYLFNRLFPGTC